MLFIVDFKKYDTELSKKICVGSMRIETLLFNRTVYQLYDGTLYRTSKGTYFFVFKVDYDTFHMKILTETEAKAFIVQYDYPKYVELFGEIEEG